MDKIKKREHKILDFPRILLYFLELVLFGLVISFFYLSESGNKNYTGVYSEHSQREFVMVLFNSLKLYNIHEIPYLGITPKIQIYIKRDIYFWNTYFIEVARGNVIIKDGVTSEEDIIIRTTEDEVAKIIKDPNYLNESISSGKTTIEKATSDFILFTKGYPDIF